MHIFAWFDRQIGLHKRKKKLGERYTSDLTTRKYTTEEIQELNPHLDFSEIDYVYQIGWCNGNDRYFKRLKNYIKKGRLNRISYLHHTEWGEDEMGYIPIGEYIQTYLFKMKTGKEFVQLVAGSFDQAGKKIIFQQEVNPVKIQTLKKRILIYPI